MRTSIRTFAMVETSLFRARIADLIEAMVDLLDSLEPDPDDESDNDDEPSLGWCDGNAQARFGATDDCEVDGDEMAMNRTMTVATNPSSAGSRERMAGPTAVRVRTSKTRPGDVASSIRPSR